MLVREVGYEGVGTVEFIVVDDEHRDKFYFLEMNTRLQVEHGVTEEVTGVDLVRHQIEVAEGKSLRLRQSDISLRGHSIECRLCAEDPAQGFQPMTGRIETWRPPEGDGVRVETGLRNGCEITPYYDSLVAKVITNGKSRDEALRLMRTALTSTVILGVNTNQQFLSRILRNETFCAGAANTSFIERHEGSLLAPPTDDAVHHEVCIVAAVSAALDDTAMLGPGQGGAYSKSYDLIVDGRNLSVHLSCIAMDHFEAVLDKYYFSLRVQRLEGALRIAINGVEKLYRLNVSGRRIFIHIPGAGSFSAAHALLHSDESHDNADHEYTATMTGVVTAIHTSPGADIKSGDQLIVMEAMKMEHSIVAHSNGVIEDICVTVGGPVQAGMTLLTLKNPQGSGMETRHDKNV